MISRGIVRYYSLHLSDCMCWFVPIGIENGGNVYDIHFWS